MLLSGISKSVRLFKERFALVVSTFGERVSELGDRVGNRYRDRLTGVGVVELIRAGAARHFRMQVRDGLSRSVLAQVPGSVYLGPRRVDVVADESRDRCSRVA